MDMIKTQRTVSKYSNWLMIITTAHHVYGAYIYGTPERLHVLVISIPVILLTYFFDRRFKKQTPPHKRIPIVMYAFIISVPSLLLIGVLEGVYNHIFKNILYFSQVPEDVIRNVFFPFYDASLFEMPNDFLFELTGIAQGFLAIPLTIFFIRYVSVQLYEKRSRNK